VQAVKVNIEGGGTAGGMLFGREKRIVVSYGRGRDTNLDQN
jgi:hypothetical protein